MSFHVLSELNVLGILWLCRMW